MTKEPVDKPEQKPGNAEPEAARPESKKKTSFKSKLKNLFATKKRRILAVAIVVALILAAVFIIPVSRYATAGLVIKKPTTITITDIITKKPVTEVAVSLAGKTVKTNSKGEAIFSSVPVGKYQLKIEKKYYQNIQQEILVPILSNPSNTKLEIKATGRNVLLKVMDKISGIPLEKATIEVSDTSAVTDKKGEASIVLPISTKAQIAKIKHDGFNDAQLSLTISAKDDQKAEISLTASGKIFYLSKRTGKINVVKSNFDGTEQEVVVAGTGQEDDRNTVLLASRDWKYLALSATRDSEKAKLYLINTSTSKLTVMDEGDAFFNLAGWSGNQFVYKVIRNNLESWEDKKEVLKSYNAETGKITTLDQTTGAVNKDWSGYVYDFIYESIGNIYILDNKLVYTKAWSFGGYGIPPSNKSVIISVKPNGEDKQRLKEFSITQSTYFDARLYAPEEVYFRVNQANAKPEFYEYENGKLASTTSTNDEKFYNKTYPTFLVSPSGQKTFWYESRDGKNTMFVGDKDAKNEKEVAALSEYIPYGWFSDDYLLVSKGGSELFILSRDNPTDKPLKVSDYHKPDTTFRGYGYGYGGQ